MTKHRRTKRKRKSAILWLHIHKAAGSFTCELARIAQEHVVLPHSNCNWVAHDMYAASGEADRLGIPCGERLAYFQGGGYSWGQIERELFPTDRCWGNFTYGVMLREPLSLMRSMMNFHPSIGKGFVESLQIEIDSPTTTDRTQFPNWKIMDNYAVRLLAPALEVPAGKITEEHYLMAKSTLSHFGHVQRLEDMPHNAGTLFHWLGWPAGMEAFIHHRVNGDSSHHQYDFTLEEAEWLQSINRYDIALYESYR